MTAADYDNFAERVCVRPELLRQALEALEYHQAQTRPIEKTADAIAALRAALGVKSSDGGQE